MPWLETIEHWMNILVQLCVVLMELIGVIVLVDTAVRSFIRWIRKNPHFQLELAQGIATALTFKMGGEVLRTVIVRDWKELGILGAIIALRGAMTFLLHWEMKKERKAISREHATMEPAAPSSKPPVSPAHSDEKPPKPADLPRNMLRS